MLLSQGVSNLIPVESSLHEKISHWLFLEDWDDLLPWRDERHIHVSIAADAFASGWGGALLIIMSFIVSL